MSELNKKKKKKNKAFSFIIKYLILAVIITAVLIYLKNNTNVLDKNVIENSNIGNSITSNIKRTKLSDKYYTNNLKIITLQEFAGEEFTSEYGSKEHKCTYNYFKISGLKNQTIEDKINQAIKDKVYSLVSEEEINNSDIKSLSVMASASGNFADLLSVSMTKATYYDTKVEKEEQYDYKDYGLNYKLDTGKEFEFLDAFTKDANIKNILSECAYVYFAREYAYSSEELQNTGIGDLNTVDYSEIENKVFKIIRSYSNETNINFFFGNEILFAIIDNKNIPIEMASYCDYINIYNLVKTNSSLYVDGNNDKINYVFGYPCLADCMYLGKLENNIYVSVYNPCYSSYNPNDNSEENSYSRDFVNNYKKALIALRDSNNFDDDKGYIININGYYEKYDENGNDLGYKYFSGEEIVVDLKNFDNEIDTVLSESSRNLSGEISFSFTSANQEKYKIIYLEIQDDKINQYVFDKDYNYIPYEE